MKIRIRRPRYKAAYIVVYLIIQLAGNTLHYYAPPIAGVIESYVDPFFATFAILYATRIFRGPGEDIVAPRAWWRMTNRPTAGFVIGSLLLAVDINSALAVGSATSLAITTIPGTLSTILLAGLYFNSSIQLVRAQRAVVAPAVSVADAGAVAATDDVPAEPTVADPYASQAPAERPPIPAEAIAARRPRGMLVITLGGALVLTFLAVGLGTIVHKTDFERLLAGGQYQAVNSGSPRYVSQSHDFSIRFPGKPTVVSLGTGGTSITYRTGVSDYSILTAALPDKLPSADSHAAYLHLLTIVATKGMSVLSMSATTVDGVPAEHALLAHAGVRTPWEYTILICGTDIYQVNTYGVTPADSSTFLGSMELFGKADGDC